jgi:Fibronectin type III domain
MKTNKPTSTKINLMISKNKLLSIGKLSIVTLLFLATYMKVAKAADPISPSDIYAVMGPNNQYIQINWIDNTLDESNFQVMVFPEQQGNPATFNVAAAPGKGTRAFINLGGLQPGSYKYRVCVQRPAGGVVCNALLLQSFNIPQAANPNPPANFSIPTNVSATRVGASTERIFWNHPGGAGGFRVYIRLPGNNNWTQAATVSGNERRADIGPLLINTNYQVGVCSVSSAGQERCSSVINVVLPQGA